MARKRENSRDEDSSDKSKKNQKQKPDIAIRARDEAAKKFVNISRNASKGFAEQNREHFNMISKSRKLASRDIFPPKSKYLDKIMDITREHNPPINYRSIPLDPSVQIQRIREERELEEKRMKYQQFLKGIRDKVFEMWIQNDKFKDELAKQYGIVNDYHEALQKAYKAGNKELPVNLYSWLIPEHSGQLTETEVRTRDYALLAIIHDGYNREYKDSGRYILKDLRKEGKIIDYWWDSLSRSSRCQRPIEEALLCVKKDFNDTINRTSGQKKTGPKPKYTVEIVEAIKTSYEKHLKTGKGKKYAWSQAAKEHGSKSAKAAEMACKRHLK